MAPKIELTWNCFFFVSKRIRSVMIISIRKFTFFCWRFHFQYIHDWIAIESQQSCHVCLYLNCVAITELAVQFSWTKYYSIKNNSTASFAAFLGKQKKELSHCHTHNDNDEFVGNEEGKTFKIQCFRWFAKLICKFIHLPSTLTVWHDSPAMTHPINYQLNHHLDGSLKFNARSECERYANNSRPIDSIRFILR